MIVRVLLYKDTAKIFPRSFDKIHIFISEFRRNTTSHCSTIIWQNSYFSVALWRNLCLFVSKFAVFPRFLYKINVLPQLFVKFPVFSAILSWSFSFLRFFVEIRVFRELLIDKMFFSNGPFSEFALNRVFFKSFVKICINCMIFNKISTLSMVDKIQVFPLSFNETEYFLFLRAFAKYFFSAIICQKHWFIFVQILEGMNDFILIFETSCLKFSESLLQNHPPPFLLHRLLLYVL